MRTDDPRQRCASVPGRCGRHGSRLLPPLELHLRLCRPWRRHFEYGFAAPFVLLRLDAVGPGQQLARQPRRALPGPGHAAQHDGTAPILDHDADTGVVIGAGWQRTLDRSSDALLHRHVESRLDAGAHVERLHHAGDAVAGDLQLVAAGWQRPARAGAVLHVDVIDAFATRVEDWQRALRHGPGVGGDEVDPQRAAALELQRAEIPDL